MASADYTLEARSPLNGYQSVFGSVIIKEITDQAIVSIAAPSGLEAALHEAVEQNLGTKWPAIGTSTTSPEGHRLMGLQADMVFVVFAHPGRRAEMHIQDRLKADCYLTDQSDAWVILSVTGTHVIDVLERICPLDLSLDSFPVGAALQTSMEHIGVTVFRKSEDCFWLLAATSYAGSFCHAVETAAKQVQ